MDLSDEKLRAQAQVECIRCEGSGCGVCRDQGKRYIALRDAARAEQQEEIDGLREALGVMGANYDDARAEQRKEALKRINAAIRKDTDVETVEALNIYIDELRAAIRSQQRPSSSRTIS